VVPSGHGGVEVVGSRERGLVGMECRGGGGKNITNAMEGWHLMRRCYMSY